MDTKKFNSKVLKAGIWYVISAILVRGISFLTTPLFTRLLSKEQFGMLTVYESWLRILFPIVTLSLYASVERAKYEFEEEYDAYIATIQLFMTGLCIGASAITACFHKEMGELLDMTDIMLAVMLLYVWAQAVINCMQRREKLLLRYRENIVTTACATVFPTLFSVGTLVYYKGLGYTEELFSIRILSFYISQVIVGIVLAILIFKRGHGIYRKKFIRFAISFSVPLIPHVLSMEILNQSDKIMVSRLAGDERAGIYSLGITVMWIVLLVSQAVGDAWLPWMYEKLKAESFTSVGAAWKEMICLFGIFGWFVVLFAPEIVWILGGKTYEEAIYLVAPLTVGGMAHFFSYSYISVEQFYKKTSNVMGVSMAAVLLNILLNYVGIIKFGYGAAAFTTAFCYSFMMVAHAGLLKLKFGRCFIPARMTIAVFLFFSIIDFATVKCYRLTFWSRCVVAMLGMMICIGMYWQKLKELIRMRKKE